MTCFECRKRGPVSGAVGEGWTELTVRTQDGRESTLWLCPSDTPDAKRILEEVGATELSRVSRIRE